MKSTTGVSSPAAPGETYSADDRSRVNQFYALIRAAWGSGKFSAQFVDADDAKHSRRYWAPEILKHSDEDLAHAIEVCKQRRLAGDTRYDWPDIGVVLGVLSEKPDHVAVQQQRQAVHPGRLLDFKPTREQRLAGIRKLREEHDL
jgi:hypothetical protein